MSTQAIRVYQLTKEWRVDTQTIMSIVDRLGFAHIGSPLATLQPKERQAVERALAELPPEEPPEMTGSPVPREPRNPSLLAKRALLLPTDEFPDPNS